MEEPVNPLDRIPEAQRHKFERVMASMLEDFERQLQWYMDYATVNGRPIFTVKLSLAEQRERWQDPPTHQDMLRSAVARDPKAASDWANKMEAAGGLES